MPAVAGMTSWGRAWLRLHSPGFQVAGAPIHDVNQQGVYSACY